MEAWQIIHLVQETYRGLSVKLSQLTDHSAEWFRSHARESKTFNPLSSGNCSPVTHYLRYVRLYEAADPGAGKMLNRRVFDELRDSFAATGRPDSAKNLHAGVLKESFDVLKILGEADFNNLSSADLVAFEEEARQLRDQASDVISHFRALRRIRELKTR